MAAITVRGVVGRRKTLLPFTRGVDGRIGGGGRAEHMRYGEGTDAGNNCRLEFMVAFIPYYMCIGQCCDEINDNELF